MIEKPQRPLIDRPRYVTKPPMAAKAVNNNRLANRPMNKSPHKRKVVDKKTPKLKMEKNQIQKPLISGSVNPIDEDIKTKSPLKSKLPSKRKPKTPRKPVKSKKDDGGVFKQMKDKFIGKSKDEDTNKDN
jgi:hypothetical protein